MASDRYERLLAAYEAWNRDDFEAIVPDLHPEIEWHSSGLFPGLEPVSHGVEGVRRWWTALKEPWESFRIDVQQHWEQGDVIAAWVAFSAIGRESGVEVKLGFANVYVFEGDRIIRFHSSPHLDEALTAAGIDPASVATS